MAAMFEVLPPHLDETFFDALSGGLEIEKLEAWVYSPGELEAALSPEKHLALLAHDYRQEGPRHVLWKLLEDYVDVARYEKRRIVRLLERALARADRLPSDLLYIYEEYCAGYYFPHVSTVFRLLLMTEDKPRSLGHRYSSASPY